LVYIAGTGSYLPQSIISNKDLFDATHLTSEYIEKITGIRERRKASPEEATSDLATRAALSALDSAGLQAKDIDLVILSTTAPDMPFPATACIVQKNLNINKAVAFDINASCSGFLYALNIAETFIRNGKADTALVIASEIKSRFVDPEDKETAILFGDGAGAVVLRGTNTPSSKNTSILPAKLDTGVYLNRRSESSSSNIICTRLYSDGKNWKWIHLPAGGSRMPATSSTVASGLHTMEMDGGKVYRAAVTTLQQMISDILKECSLRVEDINTFVFHQANLRIIRQVQKRLGIKDDQALLTLPFYGNTSSASIPITLDHAVREGRIKNGSKILMASFGGGLTWGASIISW